MNDQQRNRALCKPEICGGTLFVGAAGPMVLPQETRVRPGHDYGEGPTSTIGREMAENPYITDFILEL